MKIHAPYGRGLPTPRPTDKPRRTMCGRVVHAPYVREDIGTDCAHCKRALTAAMTPQKRAR